MYRYFDDPRPRSAGDELIRPRRFSQQAHALQGEIVEQSREPASFDDHVVRGKRRPHFIAGSFREEELPPREHVHTFEQRDP